MFQTLPVKIIVETLFSEFIITEDGKKKIQPQTSNI